MKRFIRLSIAGLLAIAVWLIVCRSQIERAGGLRHAVNTLFPPKLKSPFQSEQHWIISKIVNDLYEMLFYAKHHTAPKPRGLTVSIREAKNGVESNRVVTVTITGDSKKVVLSANVQNYLWSPDNYVGLAKQMAAELGVTLPQPPTKSPGTNLLVRLETLEAPVIEAENQRISRQLADNMLDGQAHEEAALLLGGFGLRETAGCFSDLRPTLSRMCAHLTMAEVLGQGQAGNVNSRTAEATLLVLVGRQQDALDLLEILKSDPAIAPPNAWMTALAIRATGDWRKLPRPGDGTLLERLEYCRALDANVDSGLVTDFLRHSEPEPIPDWGRIVLEGQFSVQDGHTFVDTALPAELTELQTVWSASNTNGITGEQLIELLNMEAGDCITHGSNDVAQVAVIDWGTWASFWQRHLCNQMRTGIWFIRDKWSNKEAAKSYIEQIEQTFSGLTLYPILAKRYAEDERVYRPAMQKVRQLIVHHPELVSADNWACATDPPSFCSGESVPNPDDWFVPPFPQGTTFDLRRRIPCLRSEEQVDLNTFEQFRSMMPFCYDLQYYYVKRKYGQKPSVTELRTAYGTLIDYNLYTMRHILSVLRDLPDEYQKTAQAICALQPEEYFNLGYYLAERESDDQAAAAFEKGVALTLDNVFAANNSWWLVNYYYDHGKTNEALQLAERTAEVYSQRGLATMGDLMERMGMLAEAEDYYKRIQERYGYKDKLIGFYIRANRSHPRKMYQARLETLSAEIFPNGIDFVTFADFKDAPRDGVIINSSTSFLQRKDLREGDVIVSLDGFRIRTEREYSSVSKMTQNPKMDFIIWRKGEYLENKAFIQYRNLGVSMSDYKPK